MGPSQPAGSTEVVEDPGAEAAAEPASAKQKATQHRAAKRALEIIETVAASDRALSLSELAQRANLPKSTAHSLVHTLSAEDFLERGVESGHYTLGPRLLRLLGRLPHQFELPRIARPIMQQLVDEVGETCLLGIRRGVWVIYVEQVEAPHFIRYAAPLGEPRPLHCTSIGKLFMSRMPAGELRALLSTNPPATVTAYTKVDVDEILSEARTVRAQGYALNREESIDGVVAVAAPVLQGGEPEGPMLAGLSLVGPADRMAPKLRQAQDLVLRAADQVALAVKAR